MNYGSNCGAPELKIVNFGGHSGGFVEHGPQHLVAEVGMFRHDTSECLYGCPLRQDAVAHGRMQGSEPQDFRRVNPPYSVWLVNGPD